MPEAGSSVNGVLQNADKGGFEYNPFSYVPVLL